MSDETGMTVRPPVNGELDEAEKIVAFAREVEKRIEAVGHKVRKAMTDLAPLLFAVQERRLWEVLGYDSMNEFLRSPHLDISPSYAKALAYTYRDLVIDREVPPEALEGVDLRRVQMALPAIKSGQVHWQEAVSDAQALGRHDMRVKYEGKRGPNAPINASAEPERLECPTCGSWVDKDRLEDV